MNVEFFVHGVPNGEDFWGKNEERNFFGTFYNNGNGAESDKQKFLIQAKGRYFYYSYLIYDSVKAYDGRDGSYFGMTLRFDAYCCDFMSIYRILDMVFNSYVIDKLLVVYKSKLKYSVPSFAGFDIKGMENKVFALLNDTLRGKRFENVACISSTGQVHKRNLYDCTEESVVADIRQYGKIAVSPYYPSLKESTMQQQCDSKIKTVQQQCKAQIDEITLKENTANDTIITLRNQITQLNATLQQKSNKIDELQQKVNDLNNTLARERQNKNIDELVNQIKEPVSSLAEILNGRNVVYPQKPNGKNRRVNNLIIGLVIGLVIIVIVVILAFKFCGKKKVVAEVEQARTEQITTNRKEDSATKKNPNEKGNEEEDVSENTTVENPFPTYGTFDMSKVKINIKEIISSNEKLKLGETYTVEARHGSETGDWKVKGCTKESTDKKDVIKITPTEETVTIIYCVDGKEKQRTIEAE